MQKKLAAYQHQLKQELENILSWWMEHTIDQEQGGFYGKIDHNNTIYPQAPKGSVLHARILWAFAAAYRLTGKNDYLQTAQRAFDYLYQHFFDRQYGGTYWTVSYRGNPLDTKKQFYALSFVVYAMSEYALASQSAEAKTIAIDLYKIIVQYSYDHEYGGYTEALSRNWQQMDDIRLSAKDANEQKSMNTHLHVLEAFANLYRAWPDEALKQRIEELVHIFHRHIIDPATHHLQLFFDMDWQSRSGIVSYGHDIEAAWLVPDAASVTGNKILLAQAEQYAIPIVKAAMEGLDTDGGLWYEREQSVLVRQKHSWPQAEAMIGFFYAWELTGQQQFLQQSMQSWQFVQQHILDTKGGEWVWGIYEDNSVMHTEDKAGLWKCPYHNSRACIEIIQRIDKWQHRILED